MIQYIIKRIFLFIPTLLAITLIAFALTRLAPGDPAAVKSGVGAEGAQSARSAISKKSIELWRKQMRLDLPVWQQYVYWLGDIVQGNFGVSFQDQRPIVGKIMERLPITLTMNILAVLISYIVAIPLGMYAATHQNTIGEKIAGFASFALYSLPPFWIASMAISFICNPEYYYIFPNHGINSNGYEFMSGWQQLGDKLWHLILPMLIYTYGSFAYLSRQMRSAMLETVRQDYIRTARAKGLKERTVIFKHALRNSLIPIITLLASILPGLIGGSVIIETIFSIPGLGDLSFKGLVARDYPMIMAVFTFSAILTLAGILMSDILYSFVDPRIAFDKKSN
ncbi:MAG: ABC transporter permease [Candidatus Kapabacteria bacterium]|nr:ABC transporter permease [Candidatus Kapabacteria bacterium]